MLNEVNSALANQLRKNTADEATARAVADNQPKTDTAQQAKQQAEANAVREQSRAGPQESQAKLEEAVSRISDYVQNIRRTLQFSVAEESGGRMVIRVLNTDTGELVRQIPSEEALELSAALADQLEPDPSGLLFKTDV